MVDLKSKKSPLSRRSQRLIGAVGVSNLGDGMVVFAIPLLGATLTSDPETLGMLAAAGAFPALVFALPVGGLVDRVSRGRLVISTSFIRAVMLGFLVMAVVSGGLQLWHLFAVAILLGVAELLFDTGSAALLPSVVPKAQLARANGYIATLVELSNGVLGPAIGGLLFAVTAGPPFLATCLAFAIAGIILLTVTQNQPTRPEPTASPADDARPEDTGRSRMAQFLGEIGEGIRWLIRNAPLRPLAIAVAGSNLLGWMPEAAFVLYAKKELGLTTPDSDIVRHHLGGRGDRWTPVRPPRGTPRGREGHHHLASRVRDPDDPAGLPPLRDRRGRGVHQGLPLVAWSVVSRTTLQTLVPITSSGGSSRYSPSWARDSPRSGCCWADSSPVCSASARCSSSAASG